MASPMDHSGSHTYAPPPRADPTARGRDESGLAEEVIEALPGVFYLYDDQGHFLRWNRNFERVTGYTGHEMAKLHPLDFFAGADRELLKSKIAEVFERGEASVEAAFVAKDGTETPYYFTGKRIVVAQQTCLVGMGIDISERKRTEHALRKSEERFRSTLDGTLEGCQLIDFDWRYVYLNDAAARHNRRANHELIGNRMPEMWPGIEATPVFQMLKRCMEERIAHSDEVEFQFADGDKSWFDVRAQPVPEGIFVLSIDISERKRAEFALRDLNEHLERTVIERTRDAEAARVRAEAADRIKSAFLATMSHELRTPLNSIIGFTGIMLQGMAGPLSDEQGKQLGMVRGSARHLLDLINDVLDISKIEAGQFTFQLETLDLRVSIDRALSMVRPLAEKKGIAICSEIGPLPERIRSDRRRIEQILLNLLNNAIKFTDRGSVTLRAEQLPAPAGSDHLEPKIRVQVTDTGIGMKPDDLATLFQPFRQLDTGIARQHEGTGLGLAICSRLCGLLGGTVVADSSLGAGSTFTVILPIEAPEDRS